MEIGGWDVVGEGHRPTSRATASRPGCGSDWTWKAAVGPLAVRGGVKPLISRGV